MSEITVGQIGANWGERVRTLERVGLGTSDRASRGGFEGALGGALRRVDAPEGRSVGGDELREKIHGMAEELVSAAFVRPVLAKLRETNQAAPPFAPGLWEKTFGPLLDSEVAGRIVQSSRFPLVDTLTDQLVSKARIGIGSKEAAHG